MNLDLVESSGRVTYPFFSRTMNKKTVLKYGTLCALALTIPTVDAQDAKQHTYDSFQIARGAYMDFKRIEPGTFIMGSQDKKRQEVDGPPP